MRQLRRHLHRQDGQFALVVGLAIVILSLATAILYVTIVNTHQGTAELKRSVALNAAEAGINYYLWHLSHNQTDYKDDTGSPNTPPYGPYTHNLTDTNGKVVGTFTIYVTPPPTGSTVTTIKSIGQAIGSGAVGQRILTAQLGIPSFANYILLTGTEVWFGPTENSNGPVHSNVGVHFDGANNGPVTAANATYTPTAPFGGDGAVHNGVWGNGGPTSDWQFPVPAVDFNKVTADLQALKNQAGVNGVVLNSSGAQGYYLKLKADNSIDIYKVTNEASSGAITTSFVGNQAAPANGLLYVSDNVWVEGTYSGRLTIASGVLPDQSSTNTSIKIYNNLTYTAKDGSAAVGLIAQKDIAISRNSPNNMEIDAALLAQKGHVWFPNYRGTNTKGTLTFYGAVASYDYWTWSWVDGSGTLINGYGTNNNSLDSHLQYSPPPQYPTTGTFTILNWREVLTGP